MTETKTESSLKILSMIMWMALGIACLFWISDNFTRAKIQLDNIEKMQTVLLQNQGFDVKKDEDGKIIIGK